MRGPLALRFQCPPTARWFRSRCRTLQARLCPVKSVRQAQRLFRARSQRLVCPSCDQTWFGDPTTVSRSQNCRPRTWARTFLASRLIVNRQREQHRSLGGPPSCFLASRLTTSCATSFARSAPLMIWGSPPFVLKMVSRERHGASRRLFSPIPAASAVPLTQAFNTNGGEPDLASHNPFAASNHSIQNNPDFRTHRCDTVNHSIQTN